MEPVSALGVASGAIQIFDFSIKVLLSSISFIRALRHAPEQIIELSQDIDQSINRMVNLEQRLQQADEPLVLKVSANQLRSLQAVVSEGLEAIKQLHVTLLKLQPDSTDS